MPLEVPLLYSIVLAILGFLFFHIVEYCSLKVYDEFCWDFDGDCIESIDFLW